MKKRLRRERLAAIAAREQRRPTAFQAPREPTPERVPSARGLGETTALEQRENRESCAMTLVDPSFDFYADDVPAGVFTWREVEAPCGESYRVIWHKLPGGSVGCIPVEPIPMSAKPAWAHGTPPRCHTWQWTSGPASAPNLTPSVHARGRWHGWFRNGRMESV